MKLHELHAVVWGDGHELYYVDGATTDPVHVGHFGYDDAKPEAYMDCEVTGLVCVDGELEVTATNPTREQ